MLNGKEINKLLKILIEERKNIKKWCKEENIKSTSLYIDGKIFALKEVLDPTSVTKKLVE